MRSEKITQELSGLTGFVEDMVAIGLQPLAKVLGKATIEATEEVARQLRVPIGTKVMQIRRVRMAEGVAISLDVTYLPMDLGQKVVENDLEIYPIFSLLEGKYGTPLLEADYRLEAILADPLIAEALGIEVKSPILLIERVSYSLDQRPVDYEKLFYRGDKIRLSTRLRRRQSPSRSRHCRRSPRRTNSVTLMDINSIEFSVLVCLISLAAGMLGGMLGMAGGSSSFPL